MNIHDIIKKARDGEQFTKGEVIEMLSYPTTSAETALIMGEAGRVSRELTNNTAEVHGQFALNLAPCPVNCEFCSFASQYGIFKDPIELSVEECIAYARQFDETPENTSVFLMTTANYDFGKFLEIAKEVKSIMKNGSYMVANVGDMSEKRTRQMKDAGFHGVYHAIRMGEGSTTKVSINQRMKSVRNFQDAGLVVGTCVEPIGPEHTNEQIAEHILLAASFDPAFSGAMRRITIPGSDLENYGMISELRIAQIVAVTRLATPRSVIGNCTHEPNVIGAYAGANLFWAESGGNPRDTKEKTEEGRGLSVGDCAVIFKEADWNVHTGSSNYFNKKHAVLAQPE
ncbi:Radical SAM domain protein [Denitrovibrio acetiphilus DSM 12809]|uniref:Radical SAM domain protein n=1 Tax=Denitrovibrio acetiphilus (strain DSM 12809 / NBRC 114555 / N2460) TaxID=522772 RepID=D4H6T4_DENA2|nr:radical SAM protein [Denitrovibrio acetiphilus]ADD67800.1 Radical SAM domain protein [Denitrovibrio acetiphilus DSM 12809]